MPPAAPAASLPEGFVDTEALDGLELPTAVRFSPDGRVFVAEKSGLIKVFDGLADEQPSVFADLRLQVNDYFDRGLLGLALDPGFPTEPYVYVLYTHDAEIGGAAPLWGTDQGGDDCPTPPGGFADGCVVSGRLSRLTAGATAMVGGELVLVEDWCQQFWGHSVGALAFGPDGALYASAGEGASAAMIDYGQAGIPRNPCGDPPGGVGASLAPPSAEGGALRSQDLLTAQDPLGLSGTVIRVDPATGEGLPDNPFGSAPDENLRRVVAFGLRNPFRFALRPGANELWVGDVGWSSWEEVDRFQLPGLGQPPPNGGWPCYEGPAQQPGYAGVGLGLCASLYAAPAQVTAPVFSFGIGKPVTPGEDCLLSQGSSISALAFYGGGGFPEDYEGALFFADYARRCIWAMPVGEGGVPDPSRVSVFEEGSGSAVDLQPGPGASLFYVDIAAGEVRRIAFFAGNRPPTARLAAEPTDGPVPLTVHLDASGSSDPDEGDTLEFAWDLDGDGQFDDATGPKPAPVTFEEVGDRVLSVRVSDGELHDTGSVAVHAGNTRPTATITSPDPAELWEAGESIEFAGEGNDADDGALTGPALTWSLILDHCPAACHEHFVSKASGATGQVVGPSHEYPASLRLRLTARDSGGLSASDEIELHPRAAAIHLRSEPAGVPLTLGGFTAPAPFTRGVIRGSLMQLSAPGSQQQPQGPPATFLRWSDGSLDYPDRIHSFVAQGETTFTAFYSWLPPPLGGIPPPCVDRTAPRSVLRHGDVSIGPRGVRLHGRATDRGCPGLGGRPGKVSAYVALRQKGQCRFLDAHGRLSSRRECRRRTEIPLSGFASFAFRAKAPLPPGRYLVGSLATDRSGNRESPGPSNRVEASAR